MIPYNYEYLKSIDVFSEKFSYKKKLPKIIVILL
jgi:hypothetical protein